MSCQKAHPTSGIENRAFVKSVISHQVAGFLECELEFDVQTTQCAVPHKKDTTQISDIWKQ